MKLPAVTAKAEKILEELKRGVYRPLYLLMGEEPYYIDLISDYIEHHAIQEHEREFNQTVVYGLDTDPLSLVSTVKRFPMMAERQVVIVKEAQRLKGIDVLEEIIEKPVPTTILVFVHKDKNLDKRTKVAKLFAKNGVVFQSDRVRDYEVAGWIMHFCKSRKIQISNAAVQLLSEHIGSNLDRIVSELEKLAIALPDQTEITPAVIEKHIGISKDYNVFELQKAIAAKDSARAFRIVDHFGKNTKTHPIILTNGALTSYFTKLYQYHYLENKRDAASVLRVPPFAIKEYENAARKYPAGKIERIFSYLRETDLKAKGVNSSSTDELGMLQELVYKIMH
jgi:DNA polymerase-3 subunit delta